MSYPIQIDKLYYVKVGSPRFSCAAVWVWGCDPWSLGGQAVLWGWWDGPLEGPAFSPCWGAASDQISVDKALPFFKKKKIPLFSFKEFGSQYNDSVTWFIFY